MVLVSKMSLGDYEKQVILELDKEITGIELARIQEIDRKLTRVLDYVSYCYDEGMTVSGCKVLIRHSYGLPVHEGVSPT